ncbi:hypothetical protein RHGRI_007614 [Rhododendron griersonianum]|uniref:Uncharacterized protein n=1 Tax=Rhododendron griersonianum TaxID=479676 RepID=A0AAV6KZA6_9ERIC|nr:hypothetical protein RHGRI_007614 [Rhododendron griersonianum]
MGNHFNYSYTQNQFPKHIGGQPLHSHDDQFFPNFSHSTESYTTQSYPLQSQPLHAQASVSHEPNFQSVAPQQQSSLEDTLKAFMAEMKSTTHLNTQSIAEINHFQTQAISKLENQLEQLANRMREIEEEDIYNESVANPNWQYVTPSTLDFPDEQEHVESILTFESKEQLDEQLSIPVENNPLELESKNIFLGQGTLTQPNSEDPLKTCLAHFSCDIDIDESIEQVNSLLDSTPIMSIEKWQAKEIYVPLSLSSSLALVMEPPKVDLKTLSPDHRIEILEPIKVAPIVILSHWDQNERETIVDEHRDDNIRVEWDFIFGVDLLLPTHKFCLETMLFKHIFPWYADLTFVFAMHMTHMINHFARLILIVPNSFCWEDPYIINYKKRIKNKK